jgi:hypothetical protein
MNKRDAYLSLFVLSLDTMPLCFARGGAGWEKKMGIKLKVLVPEWRLRFTLYWLRCVDLEMREMRLEMLRLLCCVWGLVVVVWIRRGT